MIFPVGSENSGREIRFIRRIRIILSFQAESSSASIIGSSLSGALGQAVCRIELHAGQISINLHRSCTGRIYGTGNQTDVSVKVIQTPVMIIAAHHGKLIPLAVDLISDSLRRAEIHGGSLHRAPGTISVKASAFRVIT